MEKRTEPIYKAYEPTQLELELYKEFGKSYVVEKGVFRGGQIALVEHGVNQNPYGSCYGSDCININRYIAKHLNRTKTTVRGEYMSMFDYEMMRNAARNQILNKVHKTSSYGHKKRSIELRKKERKEHLNEIVELRKAGFTLQQIADKNGCTKENIRQKLKRNETHERYKNTI